MKQEQVQLKCIAFSEDNDLLFREQILCLRKKNNLVLVQDEDISLSSSRVSTLFLSLFSPFLF